MHWKTLEKMLSNSCPPGYRQSKPRDRPKIGPFEERIRQILRDDLKNPKKQRHTAKRIWERMRDEEGYSGGYSSVKQIVRKIQQTNQEVFMPLKHLPGEAQVDFGFALVNISNRLEKVPFFVMALPCPFGKAA
ncbi:MAG TPA: hypothetical protein EYQ50_26480 [Verrucomicrobiales bacterium]|nr:hypothetical protein [Verrucomicrobiales bacterium]HIL69161.1 hypothetical protein [Verrucomicrobiota bacterium]